MGDDVILRVISYSFSDASIASYYRILQNYRDLKISRIAAKTGVRNVRKPKFCEGDSTK